MTFIAIKIINLINRGGDAEMSMNKNRRKIGRNVPTRYVIVCIAVAFICSLAVPAVHAEDTVTVAVDAPKYVSGTFNASISIDNVTDLNSAQFDLSFDSRVVNVTDVRDGVISGETVPVLWNLVDTDTVRVLVKMPAGEGVSGSGSLAVVEFAVKGVGGEKSELDISDGLLADAGANAIDADWYDDEVTVLRTAVTVAAPEYVSGTFNASIQIENVADLNSAQFDLSFNSRVVNVTDVHDGAIGGDTVPVLWNLVDMDTVRVLVKMPAGEGVSGSGSLAVVGFAVKGVGGDKSDLDISDGLLADADANAIEADWYDDEVTVLRTAVTVTAPEYVSGTFNASIRIDNVADLNSAQFDLSFDSRVVNVTDVHDGAIGGETVPVLWNLVDTDTVRVLVKMPVGVGVSGSGRLAVVDFAVKGTERAKSELDISDGLLADADANPIDADWYDDEVTVAAPVFDTGEGTYPSISGTHEGTITPYTDIPVQKMYTYPCAGTGGHSEYVKIGNTSWTVNATWTGYTSGYHNIVFSESFTLYAGKTYNYTIRTGSYPMIIHAQHHTALSDSGVIRCDTFVDANGRVYNDWIPAITLW